MKKAKPLTLDEKCTLVDRACSENITLDGESAIVTGVKNAFATVCSNTCSVEFAWPTVQRIMNKSGDFKSDWGCSLFFEVHDF